MGKRASIAMAAIVIAGAVPTTAFAHLTGVFAYFVQDIGEPTATSRLLRQQLDSSEGRIAQLKPEIEAARAAYSEQAESVLRRLRFLRVNEVPNHQRFFFAADAFRLRRENRDVRDAGRFGAQREQLFDIGLNERLFREEGREIASRRAHGSPGFGGGRTPEGGPENAPAPRPGVFRASAALSDGASFRRILGK